MSYNMWFVTPESEVSSADEWIDFVAQLGEDQHAQLVTGTAENWHRISVNYTDGEWSFDFERQPVAGTVAKVREFVYFRDLSKVEPAVNVQYITQYLARVRTVYMFRISSRAPGTTLALVNEILDSFCHNEPYGLTYAESEGWSNESRQQITWEFSPHASGPWWMALCRDDGWDLFQMERSNSEHRRAFRAGRVPDGVESQFYRD